MRNLLRYSLLRRCVHDMKGRRPCSFNLSAGVFESIRRSTHRPIRMRLVCCSRSASFSCCKLMLTAVHPDVTHSASASILERERLLDTSRKSVYCKSMATVAGLTESLRCSYCHKSYVGLIIKFVWEMLRCNFTYSTSFRSQTWSKLHHSAWPNI